ncbi:MAG: methylmalonyl Co-A mutase-associated GTPase MeaB [Pseudomonadota bacterium]
MNQNDLAASVLTGNRRALGKAITLIESSLPAHQEKAKTLLERCLAHFASTPHRTVRIGITGIPGVGKSTFIEAFGMYLLSLGKKIAVLAVDPSSPVAGGSILGDKTRMELLSREDNAFIRPSPTSGALGGVAHKTRETMLLCESAGYDVVLVETVGVGQSEYEVASMVDMFLVLMMPNAGDELQGIKKGIMELADALIVNKADGDSESLATRTQAQYKSALHLLSHQEFWNPPVLLCSALKNCGIDDVWDMIEDYVTASKQNRVFDGKRQQQNQDWMKRLLHDLLEQKLYTDPSIKEHYADMLNKVRQGEVTPFTASKSLLDRL